VAKQNHTTTAPIRAAAKKGLKAIDDGKVKASEVDDLAVKGAKKIASGQKLSDQHVRSMAAYHASHEGGCPGYNSGVESEMGPAATEDLMWGGPNGAMWANNRCAAMDATDLGEEDVDLDQLFSDGVELSFELFGHSHAGENVHLDEDDDGLLWAPILRSGTLAMRPGPNGQKLHEPLVFVPGHSDDPRKEIGLEDLLNAFNEGAVQHVTIPTTHENGVLDNTGFIEGMKITDSTLRPGEKLLMGAHRFTEEDAKGKVERGSVANRSCGILYDYTNTETGTSYPAVVEHVCLTNRPFVRGMEPYGLEDKTDFSTRTVVPLLLSESAGINLATAGAVSDGDWDGDAGKFTDAQYKKSCLIDRGGTGSIKERCSLPVREPGGALNRKGVHAAAGMISKLKGVSPEEKRGAAKKIVSLYRGPLKETPPPALMKLAAVSTNMSDEDLRKELGTDLNLADIGWDAKGSLQSIKSQLAEMLRQMHQGPSDEPSHSYFYVMDVTGDQALVGCDYDYDSSQDDVWVIPFSVDDTGSVELSDFSQWVPVTKEWVTDDEKKTQNDELRELTAQKPPASAASPPLSLSHLPVGSLDRASAERLALSREQIPQPTGGRSMSTLTREQIQGLNLDDAQKTALLADHDERERERVELAERRTKDRENGVKTYLDDLKGKAEKSIAAPVVTPGFLREVERALLSDDGKTAAMLNLSDAGGGPDAPQTMTQVVQRLVAALPLAEITEEERKKYPSLLESPLDGKPPAEPEKKDPDAPKTGEDLEAAWSTALGGSLGLDLAPVAGAAGSGKE
jgi:hypothetical protein